MKITNIEVKTMMLPFPAPVKIALAVIEGATGVFVRISTDEGWFGLGEASPFGPVTGETTESVVAALELFRPSLIGMEVTDLEGIHAVMDRLLAYNGSAKCAIDIALHDIIGKAAGLPLYKVLGGASPVIENDITIHIDTPEKMAELAQKYVSQGYRILKIKTGIDPVDDVEALRRIREAVGTGIRLRVDANQGYDYCTAVRVLREFADLGVEAVEQPLPHWDIAGMARLRRQVRGIQIMADESVHDVRDAMRVVQADAADVINIKLMKCGGLYPAAKINAVAEAAGVTCMLGCMADTKIAIAAAMSLVAAKKNIVDADLDGFLCKKDPEMGMKGGFTYEGSTFTISDKPGLGIDFDFDSI